VLGASVTGLAAAIQVDFVCQTGQAIEIRIWDRFVRRHRAEVVASEMSEDFATGRQSNWRSFAEL
jgi:hypothetical protein